MGALVYSHKYAYAHHRPDECYAKIVARNRLILGDVKLSCVKSVLCRERRHLAPSLNSAAQNSQRPNSPIGFLSIG
jgi:hypothetical protein